MIPSESSRLSLNNEGVFDKFVLLESDYAHMASKSILLALLHTKLFFLYGRMVKSYKHPAED
jgi:hypothetical protein